MISAVEYLGEYLFTYRNFVRACVLFFDFGIYGVSWFLMYGFFDSYPPVCFGTNSIMNRGRVVMGYDSWYDCVLSLLICFNLSHSQPLAVS